MAAISVSCKPGTNGGSATNPEFQNSNVRKPKKATVCKKKKGKNLTVILLLYAEPKNEEKLLSKFLQNVDAPSHLH